MKKVRKILLFTFLGTIVLNLIMLVVLAKGDFLNDIMRFFNVLQTKYVDMKTESLGLLGLLGATGISLIFAFAVLFTIQIRRRKSVMFPIYGTIALMIIAVLIFMVGTLSNDLKAASGNDKILGTINVVIAGLAFVQLLVLVVLSVGPTFESAEFKANSKKTDKAKLVDMIVAGSLFVLYFLFVGIISGFKYDIFSGFINNVILAKKGAFGIVFIVIQLFILGFLTFKMLKARKNVVGIAFLLFTQFVAYTFYFYGNRIDYNYTVYLSSMNFGKTLIVIFITLYFIGVMLSGMYLTTDFIISLCEPKRLKLYNHREKYVYGDRRRFGDSIVKEWENSKNQSYAQQMAQAMGKASAGSLFQSPVKEEAVPAEEVVEEIVEEEIVSTTELKEDDALDTKKALQEAAKDAEAPQPVDFREKLLALEPEKQVRYNKIRNTLQSYKKVKQRFSKTIDSYRYAGELVAKISVLGNTLRLHLALDPDSYDIEKYHHVDLSSKSKYIFVPFTLKIRSTKMVDLAIQLIDELMTGFDIPKNTSYEEQDFLPEIKAQLEAEKLQENSN